KVLKAKGPANSLESLPDTQILRTYISYMVLAGKLLTVYGSVVILLTTVPVPGIKPEVPYSTAYCAVFPNQLTMAVVPVILLIITFSGAGQLTSFRLIL